MDDAARQVLRFSTPGAVTFLAATSFLMLGRLLQGDSWDGVASAVWNPVFVGLAAFVAFPLGFVVFHIHGSSFSPFVWPWPTRLSWVRIDRGAQVLVRLPLEQRERIEAFFEVELDLRPSVERRSGSWIGKLVPVYDLLPEYVERLETPPQAAYRQRWRQNSDVLNELVEISQTNGEKVRIMDSFDRCEALGACRIGTQVAWLVSALACVAYVFAGGRIWGSLVALLATGLCAVLLVLVFHYARGRTWESGHAVIALHLRGLLKRRPDLLGPSGSA